MSRTTIDFGIDLGTTNSAIAVIHDVSASIIKNNDDQDVTPSAVSLGKNGQIFVGTRARNAIIDKPTDAYVEFKRRMGTSFEYGFKASGQQRKPEELAAEILKSLRADVERATGETIRSAVITVPAAFELHQCDATRKAAELAGLEGSPLLQEPVAAALAYGFQSATDKAYWLVYDFGGGTFDAALIKAEDGMINVVHHGGDNFLGGTDIDWALVEKTVIPKLTDRYDLPDFRRGSERWHRELLKLKRSVELAKIELTSSPSTTLADCRFEDASGDEVDVEDIILTQAEVLAIAEPIIRRSVEICHQVLREKNLKPGDVQKVILVGGPTKAPYFRNILAAELGIPVDHSVDPLTVVAKGAAIFAGGQRLQPRENPQASSGEYKIDLKYKPMGHELDPMVGGRVTSHEGRSPEGLTIEFVNTGTQWRSGRINLKEDGVFMTNILAERGRRNVFSIELLDRSGSRLKAAPDQLVYTVGATLEEQPLIHSMGVALAGNEWERFFEKGAGLPIRQKGKTPFRTVKALKAGESGAAITIPIVEGENDAADRNRLVGSFEITSEMIRRDLPAGSEIEILLSINESRIITVEAYVPVIDEEFRHQFDLRKKVISHADISKDHSAELSRMRELLGKAHESGDTKSTEDLETLRDSSLAAEIRSEIAAAAGDPDAAEKADKRLLEFKLKLDEIENHLKWPILVNEAEWMQEETYKLAMQHGTARQQDRYEELREECAEAIREHKPDQLKNRIRELRWLYSQILTAQPAFWVDQFGTLRKKHDSMSDRDKASHLFDMGNRYLTQNNVDGLRNVVKQLWDLLPPMVAEEMKRGVGSTLIR